MQQPLVQLYFVTVLEHLTSKQMTITTLVNLAVHIRKICNSSQASSGEQVLLWIELQAVSQVIAQTIPNLLVKSKVAEFMPLKDDIDR